MSSETALVSIRCRKGCFPNALGMPSYPVHPKVSPSQEEEATRLSNANNTSTPLGKRPHPPLLCPLPVSVSSGLDMIHVS